MSGKEMRLIYKIFNNKTTVAGFNRVSYSAHSHHIVMYINGGAKTAMQVFHETNTRVFK